MIHFIFEYPQFRKLTQNYLLPTLCDGIIIKMYKQVKDLFYTVTEFYADLLAAMCYLQSENVKYALNVPSYTFIFSFA